MKKNIDLQEGSIAKFKKDVLERIELVHPGLELGNLENYMEELDDTEFKEVMVDLMFIDGITELPTMAAFIVKPELYNEIIDFTITKLHRLAVLAFKEIVSRFNESDSNE